MKKIIKFIDENMSLFFFGLLSLLTIGACLCIGVLMVAVIKGVLL